MFDAFHVRPGLYGASFPAFRGPARGDAESPWTRNDLNLLFRQVSSFVGVGIAATLLHYSVLVALVQIFAASPPAAALCGCVCGAVLSYGLNRKHTFASERPHEEAAWRFSLVAGVAFAITYGLMRQMVEVRHLPYLPAQVITTCVVMIWTFAANRLWTFRGSI